MEPASSSENSFATVRLNLQSSIEAQKARVSRRKLDDVHTLEGYQTKFADNPDRLARNTHILESGTRLLEHALERLEQQLVFLRPAASADVAERLAAHSHLADDIRRVLPPDSPLRFHGAAVFDARGIIATGGISSSADRLGTETSYDTAGQISVTSVNNSEVSVEYATIKDTLDYNLPAGCIFVVLPLPEEVENTQNSLAPISNIDFRREPHRLVNIITSAEMKPVVAGWCRDGGIRDGLVTTFGEFPAVAGTL